MTKEKQPKREPATLTNIAHRISVAHGWYMGETYTEGTMALIRQYADNRVRVALRKVKR
jgi:hypothetical protein